MDLSYQESYAMNPKETRRKVVETYLACGSISATARQWKTSRNVVRKWVRRYQEEGIAGLEDRSHRPHHSPNRTADDLEEKVVAARQATGYGRKRLAWYLWREEGVVISPHTIRHILRRHGMTGKRKRCKTFYPAHWSWEEERPFALAQVDVKDILDKKLEKLQKKFYEPLGARLARIPVGRREYNGRVERSHRTDDEEFLRLARRWQCYYNVERPHFGAGMEGKTPMEKLRKFGLDLPDEFACFPVILLDKVVVI